MSRSCHSAMFSRAACELPRSSRASPTICSQPMGFPFVRHRRRAFLALRERLFHLADFCFLQPPDFECEFLEGGAGNRQCRKQLRVPIALNDL